jgi:tape measure domain-containing protein
MAMNLDAILRVAAKVTGRSDVQGLGRDVAGAGRSAAASAGGFRQLSVSLGSLRDVARVLGFTGLVTGLTAFAVQAVQAGESSNLLKGRLEAVAGPFGETERVMAAAARVADQFSIGQLEAKESMAGLYATMRPLGVSLAEIETTFIGVTKATRLAGLGAQDAREVYRQLGQAIGSGALMGEEFNSLMDRIPMLGQKIVDVMNRIRSEGGLTLITRQQANDMVREVEDGEKRQTEAMKEGARQRREALEENANRELRLIQRHYEERRKIIDDSNTDQDTEEDRARGKRLKAQEDEIRDRYRVQIEGLSAEDEALRESLQKRQDEEIDALREAEERQTTIRRRQLRDQREERERALADEQRSAEEAVRKRQEQAQRDEDAALEKSIAANKAANEKIIAGILARVEVTRGELKQMASEGLIPPKVVQMALDEMAKMKAPKPTALIEYNTAFKNLTTSIGEELLPKLTPLIEKITKLIGDPKFQQALSELVKNIGEVLVPLIKPLIETLSGILKLFAAIPPGLREAIVKTAVFIGLLRLLGATGILGGLKRLADGFKGVASSARGAGQAVSKIPETTGKLQGLGRSGPMSGLGGYRGPERLPPLQEVKPPPSNMFAGFLAELGRVGQAMGGLLREVGKFGAAFLREIAMAIPGLGRLGQAFANLRIGATISGWLGAIGPFAGRAIALIAPLLTWITGTFLPTMVAVFSGPTGWIALGIAALVAAVVYFREPIWEWLQWAGQAIGNWWNDLSTSAVQFAQNTWNSIWQNEMLQGIIDGIGKWLESTGKWWQDLGESAGKWIENVWDDLWSGKMLERITNSIKTWTKPLTDFWDGIIKWVDNNFMKRWEAIWEKIKSFPGAAAKWIADSVSNAFSLIVDVWAGFAEQIRSIWAWVAGKVVEGFNKVIDMYNSIATRLPTNIINLPVIQRIQEAPEFGTPNEIANIAQQAAPRFATGGFVSRPTLGWIGEGRDPGGEYAIPAGQMDRAMAGWARGLRGQALISASRSSAAPAPAQPPALPDVRISLTQTGPTLVTPDGQDWISRQEAVRLIEIAVRSQNASLGRLMASAAGRSAWGMR